MELTYNKATKQHGYKDQSQCPYCQNIFVLETTDKNKFNKAPCFERYMKGYTQDA